MRFVRATGGTFTDAFTLTRSTTPPPPNQPPTATFTSTASGLDAAFDASGSTDPDGAVVSYAWDFGDGTSGVGPTPGHTYAQAGTYSVTLTVTDDDGGTSSHTAPVTVSGTAPQVVLAADRFERTVVGGWGTADVGGPWTVSTAAGVSSVLDGKARTVLGAPSTSRSSTLAGVSSTETDMLLDLSLDRLPTGSGASVYHSSLTRRISGSSYYRAMVRVLSTGAVRASLHRMVAGTGLQLGNEITLPGITYAPGDTLRIRAQATGTSPTTLRMRTWKVGTPEPSGWQLVATDSSAPLQVPGSVGIISYLPSSVTNAPVQVRFDDLQVTRAP
jgi:PKD repeat protein